LTLALLALFCGALPAHSADTLADVGIELDPVLIAEGIDPGERHPVAGELHHAEAVPQFIRQQTGPAVFIGDSIIAFMPAGLLPSGAVNLAVSGNMTTQILASVARIPANASVVYVEGGINDMLNLVPGQVAPNYAKILAAIPSGARVKVIGILPVNEAQLAGNRDFLLYVDNQKIAAQNGQIAPLCTARCSLVPSPFGKSLPANAAIDGIHLTVPGKVMLGAALH